MEQFCEIFYNAQIIYYHKDVFISKKYSIYIGWMYHHNESGKIWIESRKDNIKSNILFHGLNLDDVSSFTDQVVVGLDTDNIMWQVY